MGHTGLERAGLTSSDGKQLAIGANESGAESGAVPFADERLDALIKAWPSLPDSIRQRIINLIEGGD